MNETIGNNVLDSNDDIRNISSTRGGMDISRAKNAVEKTKANKTTKKRGRPRKTKKEEKEQILAKKKEEELINIKNALVFLLSSSNKILEKYDIEELSEQEIEQGAIAWAPLVDRYFGEIADSVWVPPLMWTGMTILSRLPSEKEKEYNNGKTELVSNS